MVRLLLLWTALWGTAFGAPATMVQTVTYNSETITMRLTLQNLRGANFEMMSQNAAGGYDVVTAVDERSYIGTIDEYPGAVSCGILQDDGLFRGAVYFDRGVTWFTLDTSVVGTRALDYGTFSNFQNPSAPTVSAGQGGSTMYGYELGVDADHNYYTTAGSSMAKALEQIEYSVAVVRAIYMRDVLLRPYLGRVIVRSTLAHDPYTGLTQGSYLDAVRLEWNNNQTDTDPDLVAGVSPTKIGGGLAWVGVVGTSSGYSVNQSGGTGAFDVVFRHEMGHNWNCGHFVGGSPEGAGLMGGNAPGRFSSCEAYRVMNHRDAKALSGIVDAEGTYTAVELPPFASLDAVNFILTIDSSITIDVLANDHDANGQTLSLVSFDSSSAQGGSVTQQGQSLVYLPATGFLGTDSFTYKITDTAGKTATGVVVVDVQPDGRLRLHLPLDETGGTTAYDQSVFVKNGTVAGTDFATSSITGKFGNALNFDAVDDAISVPGVALNANTVTLTGWINPGVTPTAWSGIIFDRSSGASGLNIGTAGELRYHWNNQSATYNWNSGLVPPTGTWTFVALVIEPTQATIYMNSGAGFQSAVNTLAHTASTFGTTYIGRDPSNGSRYFSGAIDDARIYDESLSQAELQNIYDGGGAESPLPLDGGTGVQSCVVKWSEGASAVSYQVYMGTNQVAVNNATTASPEYLGATTLSWHLVSLGNQTQYFWRVDTVTASTTLPGSVWSFTTGDIPSAGVYAWEKEVYTGSDSILNRTASLAGNSSTTIDLSSISSDATYEFVVNAEDLGRNETRLLDGNGWSLRFEQVTSSRNLGLTEYGVLDYHLTAEAGQSVASPYGRVAHLAFVVDSSIPQTRVYLDGVLVGTQTTVPNLADVSAVLGSSGSQALRDDSDPGILAFAAYNNALDATEILAHSSAWYGGVYVDADADTLNDNWEITHYGIISTVVASDDTDGDGFTAFQEMVFGMDPNVKNSPSVPQQASIVDDGGTDKMEFKFRRPQSYGTLNVSYQLQTGNDMVEANWANDATTPTVTLDGTNEWVTFLLPLPSGAETRAFCRLKVTPN